MDENTTIADGGSGAAVESAHLSWTAWITEGLRASALLRVRRTPDGPGAWTMLLIFATLTALTLGASRFEVVGPAEFDFRSWLFGWAPVGLILCGAWFVLAHVRAKTHHASPVAAWYLLNSIAMAPVVLFGIGVSALASHDYLGAWWSEGHWSAWALYVGPWIWALLATWRVTQAITRSTAAVAALLVVSLVIWGLSAAYLHTQAWQADESHEGADEDEFAWLELSQEVFESQQALLSDALQAIEPTSGDDRLVYGLVYAPYSEDVFLRESAMVEEVLEQRFGASGRTVRLVNNPATTEELPWATTLNLQRSLQALAQAMNKERDVLVVYLTSHGGADFKLAAEHWPLEVEALTAAELRAALDKLGVRNRVIAVSACYSGGWVEPLQSDDTLIMTAADKEHTSYGCGSKSPLTFFGRAVFDEQLRKTLSFEEAFKAAAPLIKQREIEAKKADGYSNPQISVGKNIRAVLDELVQQRARTVADAPS